MSDAKCADCGRLFTSSDERCPNCGLPAAVAAVSDHEPDVLGRDVICRKCGYNLRGLQRTGCCPECAAPIAASVRGDFLCFAEPRYVRKLARGNWWVPGGLIIVLAAGIIMFPVMILYSVIGLGGGLPGNLGDILEMALAAMLSIAVVAGLLMFLAGLWLITAAEPSIYDTRRRDAARRWVRIALLAGLLGEALTWIVPELTPPIRVMAAFHLLALGFGVIVIVGLVAYFRYLGGIIERLPDSKLAQRAVRLGGSLAVAIGVLLFFDGVDAVVTWGPSLISPGTSPPPAASAPALPAVVAASSVFGNVRICVEGVAKVMLLVLFVRAVVLHSQLRKPLNQQAVLAERHWKDAAEGLGAGEAR